MLQAIIWLMGLLCPNPTHTIINHGNCQMVHIAATSSTEGDVDTGGETSNPIPKPPVPPLPPGN